MINVIEATKVTTAPTALTNSTVGKYTISGTKANYVFYVPSTGEKALYSLVNTDGTNGFYNKVIPSKTQKVLADGVIYTFTTPAPAWRAANTTDAQGTRVSFVAVAKTASEVATEYNNNTNCIMKSSATKPTTYDQYIFDATNSVLYKYVALVKDMDNSTAEYIQIWEKFTPVTGTLIAVGSGTSATTYIYSRAAGSWA